MSRPKSLVLPCTITLGGFSDERVFRVELADGGTHTGACHKQYCYTKVFQQLKEGQPEKGKSIDGYVLAMAIREEDDGTTLVSVPDAEVILVKTGRIKEAPKELPLDVLV